MSLKHTHHTGLSLNHQNWKRKLAYIAVSRHDLDYFIPAEWSCSSHSFGCMHMCSRKASSAPAPLPVLLAAANPSAGENRAKAPTQVLAVRTYKMLKDDKNIGRP